MQPFLDQAKSPLLSRGSNELFSLSNSRAMYTESEMISDTYRTCQCLLECHESPCLTLRFQMNNKIHYEENENRKPENNKNEGFRHFRRPLLPAGSIKTSVFNLTNATLGAGIVSVPYAFMKLGIIPGCIAIFFFGVCTVISTQALVQAINVSSEASYEGMAFMTGGSTFAFIVQFVMVIFNFGAAIGYLVCVGDIFIVIIEAYGVSEVFPTWLLFLLNRKIFISIICLGILLPVSTLDKLSSLRILSFIGVISLELLVIVTCIISIRQGPAISLGPWPYTSCFFGSSFISALKGLPLLVFAFSCQSNAPAIYAELHQQCSRRMTTVALRSVITSSMTYFIMGVSGYMIFGTNVQSNVLLNFTEQLRTSLLVCMAFFGILIGVLLSFPMNIYPCRIAIEAAIYPDGSATQQFKFITSVCLVIISLILALVVPSVALLFSLTGSTCGACIAFIFPGIFVIQFLPLPPTHYRYACFESCSDTDTNPNRKIIAWILVVLGLIIAVVGTSLTVAEIVSS